MSPLPIPRKSAAAPSRCLLLGASGFIGEHVRRRLAEVPDLGLVTAALAGDVEYLLDLTTVGPAQLAGLLREVAPDVVVNCVGLTGGDVASLIACNVVAVSALTEAIARTGEPIRLVHLGSAAEYQPVAVGAATDEHTPTVPNGPYGVTKLAGTALVLAARSQGLPATVLRVFNPLGPYAPPGSLPGRLIAELLRTRGTSEPVRVGSLDGYRDFIDVRDVAGAIAAAATAVRPLPPVINIGSGRATSLRDLAAATLAAAGRDSVVETAGGSPRSSAVLWQQADISTAVETLSWRPEITLAESVRDAWLAAAGATVRSG